MKSKLRKVMLVLVLLVGGTAVVLAFMANQRRLPPRKPGKHSIKLQKTPAAAKEWDALLERKRGMKSGYLDAASIHNLDMDAMKAFARGRWFGDPEGLKAYFAQRRGVGKKIEEAMQASGCPAFEIPSTMAVSSATNWLGFLRAFKGLTYEAVLWAQQGDPARAAKRIVWLFDRLYFYEQSCKFDLIGSMIVVATAGILYKATTFLSAHPRLSVKAHAELLKRLLAWERRPPSMAQAFRIEGLLRKGLFANPQAAVQGTTGSARTWAFAIWPLYDFKSTVALSDRLTLCHVKAVYTAPMALKPCPIEIYLHRVAGLPPHLLPFHYNSVGKALLSMLVVLKKFIVKWQTSRCLAAARRAQLLRHMPKALRDALPKALRAEPLDPMRNKPFAPFKGKKRNVCGFSPPGQMGISINATFLTRMPTAPPTQKSTPSPQDGASSKPASQPAVPSSQPAPASRATSQPTPRK